MPSASPPGGIQRIDFSRKAELYKALQVSLAEIELVGVFRHAGDRDGARMKQKIETGGLIHDDPPEI